MNHAWFNCAAGVAGDMLLASLVDAGADADTIAATVAGLDLHGWALAFERVKRGSITALYANVATDSSSEHSHSGEDGHRESDNHEHRPVAEIFALLDKADLPERVRERASRVFSTLAAAEGAVHGIDPADVELHEAGSIDAIVDVVGVCAALESLQIDTVSASAIGVSAGSVSTAHGRLPTPAPAVVRMLAAARIPVNGVDTPFEIATPTGVAVLATLADSFGPPPAMTVVRTGFGAGTANPLDRPNIVNVLVGELEAGVHTTQTGATVHTMIQIETNVDDVSGEIIAHTIGALLSAGARDAWATPIVMKKGRPAHTVHVLAAGEDAETLTALLLRETGSLGARTFAVTRTAAERDIVEVDVDGHPVRVKRSANRVKAEFDDAARAAEALGRPVREVLRDAEASAYRI